MGTQARPNIVFVLCDNVGWGDFSCYGGSTPTPRIASPMCTRRSRRTPISIRPIQPGWACTRT
jgi:hypothetical protein